MNNGNSHLGLGCWAYGGNFWKEQSHKDSVASIREALTEGVEHFDTAASYGNGRSEQTLGQQIGNLRGSLSIATKGLYHPPQDVEAGIRKSLRRLHSDYVDIYYIHWPKPDIDLRPMVEALEKARDRGLIRYIGVSNFSPPEIEPLLEAGSIDYCQFGYNLIWRVAELSLIPFCSDKGIKMVTYGSLAEGLLADEEHLPSRLAEEDPRKKLLVSQPPLSDRVERILMEIYSLAREDGVSPAQLALMWNLSRPWDATVLFGARNPAQVKEDLHVEDRFHREGLGQDSERRLDELTIELRRIFDVNENIFGHRPR